MIRFSLIGYNERIVNASSSALHHKLGSDSVDNQAPSTYIKHLDDCNPDIFNLSHFLTLTFDGVKTVAAHIGRIRDKVEKDPHNPVHIQTVWEAGYRFKV